MQQLRQLEFPKNIKNLFASIAILKAWANAIPEFHELILVKTNDTFSFSPLKPLQQAQAYYEQALSYFALSENTALNSSDQRQNLFAQCKESYKRAVEAGYIDESLKSRIAEKEQPQICNPYV